MKGFINFLVFAGIVVFVLGIIYKLYLAAPNPPVMNVFPVTMWRFCIGCWLLACSLTLVQIRDAKSPQP
jgi:hypothetical protein